MRNFTTTIVRPGSAVQTLMGTHLDEVLPTGGITRGDVKAIRESLTTYGTATHVTPGRIVTVTMG